MNELMKIWMYYLFCFFLIPTLNIKLVTSSYLFSFKLSPQPVFPSFPIFIALLEHLDEKEHKII